MPDGSRGRAYYFNYATRQVSWQPPIEWLRRDRAGAADKRAAERRAARQRPVAPPAADEPRAAAEQRVAPVPLPPPSQPPRLAELGGPGAPQAQKEPQGSPGVEA